MEILSIDINFDKILKYLIIIGSISLFAILANNLLRKFMTRFMHKSNQFLNTDETQLSFVKNALSTLVFISAIILIFYSIPELKALGVTLFAGAGIATAIILLASQQLFSNIFNGIFIVWSKPFKVNDIVKVSDKYFGKVTDITLRHTIICDPKNQQIIIPNSTIGSEVLINSSNNNQRLKNFIDIGVSYNSNLELVESIIKTEARMLPEYIDGRSDEEISNNENDIDVWVTEWADSSIKLRIDIWSSDFGNGFKLKSNLLKVLKKRFNEEGIEIPFPHIVVKN